MCTIGQPHLCSGMRAAPGTFPDGTRRHRKADLEINSFGRGMSSFAEYSVVHQSAAIKINPEMPMDGAALIGCAVMTGVGAVLNTARVEPGSTVAVFATGGVGLSVVQGAVLANASKIIAIDVLDNKLDYASGFGATHIVNSRKQDPLQAIRDITDGQDDDVVGEGAPRKRRARGRRVKRRPQRQHRKRCPPSRVVPSFVTLSELHRGHSIGHRQVKETESVSDPQGDELTRSCEWKWSRSGCC